MQDVTKNNKSARAERAYLSMRFAGTYPGAVGQEGSCPRLLRARIILLDQGKLCVVDEERIPAGHDAVREAWLATATPSNGRSIWSPIPAARQA